MLLLIPSYNKKMIWGVVVPLLAAAVGFKFSISQSQIDFVPSPSATFIYGDTIYTALNLSFPNFFPAFIFCLVVSLGTEISFRSYYLEIITKAKIIHPWFFVGLTQFIAFLPFLWFGYFGGGEKNIVYIVLWFFLIISLSGFNFWLSLSFPIQLNEKEKLKKRAVRSLFIPILSSSLYLNIYYVVAARTFVENGNLWMSGPANVIIVVIYSVITIFLLMTKRLKY